MSEETDYDKHIREGWRPATEDDFMIKDAELKLIGEDTQAIFDKIKGSSITSHDRVLALYGMLRCIEARVESIATPYNLLTLLIISECLSELTRLELELRPADKKVNKMIRTKRRRVPV